MGSLGFIGLLFGFYKVYIDLVYGSYSGSCPPENVLDSGEEKCFKAPQKPYIRSPELPATQRTQYPLIKEYT